MSSEFPPRSLLIHPRSLSVSEISASFQHAIGRWIAITNLPQEALFSSQRSGRPDLSLLGLFFSFNCFSSAVSDKRAVFWATFKGHLQSKEIKSSAKSLSDETGWCTIHKEHQGLDLALTDGHGDMACVAEFEGDSIRRDDELNDLKKILVRPAHLRVYLGRANSQKISALKIKKYVHAQQKMTSAVTEHSHHLIPSDQLAIVIAVTSAARVPHYLAGRIDGTGEEWKDFWFEPVVPQAAGGIV